MRALYCTNILRRRICLALSALLFFGLPAASAETTLSYRTLAKQQRGPNYDDFKWRALVTDRGELRRSWERFNMRGDPPRVGFERKVGVFAGSGGSSSCPLYVVDVRLRRAEREIVVRVSNDPGGSGACTDDWIPTTFLLGIRKRDLPPLQGLNVRVHRVR